MEDPAVKITTPHLPAEKTALGILLSLSLSHLLNDTIQSLLPALYPLFKESLHLSFAQIGLITFTFQLTASLLQPVVGFHTDRRPRPFSLAIGMAVTLVGLIALSQATSFHSILVAAAFVGTGSSVFHPEASRVARLASGGRHGFAQSVFQVGGNFGSSLGPLLAAAIVVPRGQASVLWFSLVALAGIVVLFRVGRWYRDRLRQAPGRSGGGAHLLAVVSPRQVRRALVVLVALIFSKYIYTPLITRGP